MSLPDKGTKHIPKPQAPIGAQKNGKLKIIDGSTGRVSWRQGTKGFAKDYDGDPIATQYGNTGLKKRPKHHAKSGGKTRGHRPSMGDRPQHVPGHSGEDSE